MWKTFPDLFSWENSLIKENFPIFFFMEKCPDQGKLFFCGKPLWSRKKLFCEKLPWFLRKKSIIFLFEVHKIIVILSFCVDFCVHLCSINMYESTFLKRPYSNLFFIRFISIVRNFINLFSHFFFYENLFTFF